MTRHCSFVSIGSLGEEYSFGISYVLVMYWLPVLLTVFFVSWKKLWYSLAYKLTSFFVMMLSSWCLHIILLQLQVWKRAFNFLVILGVCITWSFGVFGCENVIITLLLNVNRCTWLTGEPVHIGCGFFPCYIQIHILLIQNLVWK
jgi:hypothetical protein